MSKDISYKVVMNGAAYAVIAEDETAGLKLAAKIYRHVEIPAAYDLAGSIAFLKNREDSIEATIELLK